MKSKKKSLIIIPVIILLLLVTILGGLFFVMSNAKLQSALASQMLGKDVVVSGDVKTTFESFSGLRVTFSDYVIKEKQSDAPLYAVENAAIKINLFGLLSFGTSIPEYTGSNIVIHDRLNLKPVRLAHLEKTVDGVVAVVGSIGEVDFEFSKDQERLDMTSDALSLSAKHPDNIRKLNDVRLSLGGYQVKGDLSYEGSKASATFFVQDQGPFSLNVQNKGIRTEIDIQAEVLRFESVEDIVGLIDAFRGLRDQIQKPKVTDQSRTSRVVKTSFKVERFEKNEVNLGRINATIEDSISAMTVSFSGTNLAGAPLDGRFYLSKDQDKKSEVKFQLKEFDYLRILNAFDQGLPSEQSGLASLIIDAEGAGGSINTLKKTSSGEIEFRANDGSFDARLINLWGGGLLNHMIPSFDEDRNTKLNCARLDVSLADGVAEIDLLLLDTGRVTVYGKGGYDISQNELALLLQPKNKGLAIGNIASAIEIKGPIQSPTVQPNTLSLIKKLGTVTLGTFNPAFYLFSIADLGLNADDPCE